MKPLLAALILFGALLLLWLLHRPNGSLIETGIAVRCYDHHMPVDIDSLHVSADGELVARVARVTSGRCVVLYGVEQ